MNKPTHQQVIEAYKKLPPPVREFLADPDKLARVLENIRNAHNLHIDVAGQIGESVGYLLLGLANPNEFKEMLKTASVSESTASEIIGEINQKVFVPLREEMRKGAPVATQPPRPAIQHPPLSRPVVAPSGVGPRPITEVRPSPNPPAGGHKVEPQMQQNQPPHRPATSAPYFHLQNKIPPLNAPRSGASGDRSAPKNGLAPVLNSNIAPLPPKNVLPQGSQGSMGPKLLRDREEPHLEIKKTAPPPPKPSFAPPNLPGVIQPPAPPVPPPPVAPAPPAKPYTTDPYREPIGGK